MATMGSIRSLGFVRYPFSLDDAERGELFERYKGGDETAKWEMIEHSLLYAIKIAKQQRGWGLPFLDTV